MDTGIASYNKLYRGTVTLYILASRNFSMDSSDAHGAGNLVATEGKTSQVNTSAEEREPLLGNRNKNTGESLPKDIEGNAHVTVAKTNNLRNCRSLVLLAVLWLVMLFINAAYSLIAPFFPKAVRPD